jgi:Ser/Thr protein kinase RdoA (MazF antagonist)
MTTPTLNDLRAIAREVIGSELVSAKRFATGNCHYVFDAALADGRAVVLRIAKPENRSLLAGAVHWSGILKPMGFPLPEILHARLEAGCTPYPYLVLERLPGTDLGEVYSRLSSREKKTLADRLASMQKIVGSLPEGAGFGFQSDPGIPPPFASWGEAIDRGIERSALWIEQARVVDGARVEVLRAAARRMKEYFDTIRPRPFLDDITTKNVLIDQGKLCGIVDVDEICYGDRVAHLGLTRMALMSESLDLSYIEYWCEALSLDDMQRRALDFYTAESCLCFLGEQGQRFNRDEAQPVRREAVARLERIFDGLVTGI